MKNFESHEGYVPTVEIMEPAREDLPQIVKVERAAVVQAYTNEKQKITSQDIIDTYAAGGEVWLNDIVDVQRGNKDKKIWVAKQDNVVMGVCLAKKNKQDVSIDALYVKPDVQRTGAGTRLMEQVFEWAGPQQEINLDVVAYNQQAINFYTKFGFQEEQSKKSKHAMMSGKSMPMLRLVRKVQKKAA